MADVSNVISSYMANTLEAYGDIGRMLEVVAGLREPLLATADNIVSTKVSLQRPETLMPLATGLVVAFFYVKLIESVGRWVARACRLKGRKIEKFADSWCEAVYFSGQIFISYRLFSGTSWFWPSGWPSSLDDGLKGDLANGLDGLPPYHCTREVRAYYVCEFGYYTVMFFAVFFKRRRKDFWELVFHHVVTSTLIGLSYSLWHLRFGVIVMMIHNLFDPFLNIAKCAHYVFNPAGTAHVIADVSFGVGAVVFLVSRLIYYPYAIYCTVIYASPLVEHPHQPAQTFLKVLLSFLYPLHVFWFVLILKVAHKALFSGTVQGDERSDSEDDEIDNDKARALVDDSKKARDPQGENTKNAAIESKEAKATKESKDDE
jgi:ceramide synthetase